MQYSFSSRWLPGLQIADKMRDERSGGLEQPLAFEGARKCLLTFSVSQVMRQVRVNHQQGLTFI